MRFPSRLLAALFILLALAASASGAPKAETPLDRTEFVLGTVCSIRLLDGASKKALDAAFKRLFEIEATMSINTPGTIVGSVNAAAGNRPVKVPKDVLDVTRRALYYTELTGSAFDPTIGPIVKLWNIGLDGERVPEPWEIEQALPLVDAKAVEIDERAGTIYLSRAGMLLDLGGIAKGYAADEVGRILSQHGVKAAVIDLGGNVKVVGRKPDGSKWRIGVQNPSDARGAYIGIASLGKGATVVTSGIYERYFIDTDGRSYHHIFDTRTGYPVEGELFSVTVISTTSMDADGLSTALFALGLKRGMSLAESQEDVEAIFIDSANRVYISSGASSLFTLTDKNYTLAELP
ncbi:MAG: FAD:protein FMN transferase [Spirochaetota bacterium]